MRRRLLFVFCSAACLAACGGTRTPVSPEPLPAWITSLIRELESKPPANPPAFIGRYEFKGGVVYFLPQRCCDIPSTVYGTDGTVVCHPDGGFTGAGDGRCPEFFAERKDERIIWRDPRAQ